LHALHHSLDRRRFLKLTGAGVAATALTGLTGGSAFAQQGQSLNSWYFAQEPNNTVFRERMASFTEATGTPVEGWGVAFNSYLDQTILAARSGRLSGVLHLDFNWLPAMSQLNVLRPMDDLLPTLGFTEAGQRLATHEGTALGLPVTAATINTVGNVDLLEKAGLNGAPTTIAQFEDALDKLKGLAPDMVPYALSTVPSESVDYLVWMWQFGSPVMEGDEVRIGDDASVAAMEWIKSLYDAGYMAPSIRRFDARALFANERTGFYEDAIIARSNAVALSNNPDFGRKVIPVPRPGLNEGDRPRSSLWGNVMAVINDDNAEAALELAKFMTADPGTNLALFEGIGLPPATDAGLALPEVAGDEYTAAWSRDVTAFADIKPFARFPEVLRLEGVVGEAVERILLGAMPVRESLEMCAEEVRQIIG
jgi:ABC-type glycerol-3-phosphate transport system substrate-binding protein